MCTGSYKVIVRFAAISDLGVKLGEANIVATPEALRRRPRSTNPCRDDRIISSVIPGSVCPDICGLESFLPFQRLD